MDPTPAVGSSGKGQRSVRRSVTAFALAVAVTATSTLLALALGEGLVRAVAPQQLIQARPDLWQPADSVAYLHRPNVRARINTGDGAVTVITDHEGFRIGASGRKEAETQVLLMGDSFVEALQVEYERSTAPLLEAELARTLSRPVVVRNGGIDGWDPNQYRIRTRALLARDSYDLVVVAVFVGNDAVTAPREYFPPRVPEERRAIRFPRSLAADELIDALARPLNDALESRSHLFVLAKNRGATLRMRLGLTAQYFPDEYRRSQAESPRWRQTATILRALQDECAERGTPVLFVLIPERFQVYSSDYEEYLRGFRIDPATVDLDQPSRLLYREMRAVDLRVIDALDPFRVESAVSAPLFGKVDAHLSAAGHALLARLLVRESVDLLSR